MNPCSLLDEDRIRFAFRSMTLEMISEILHRANKPLELGKYITEEFRELSGAKIVVLFQFMGQRIRIVSLSPERQRPLFQSPEMEGVLHHIRSFRGPILLNDAEQSGALGQKFQGLNIGPSVCLPLRIGEDCLGALLLLDIPSPAHSQGLLQAMEMLCALIAMVLRHGFLFETQEEVITERTRLLEQSERTFRSLASVSPVGIFRAVSSGHWVYANQRLCEMIGVSLDEVMGSSWQKTLCQEDRSRAREKWDEMVQGRGAFSEELCFLHPDGRLVWVWCQAVEERDDQKGITGFVGAFTNVTDQKRLEIQLREAQKMEAIGRLAGGVAHDFNNILAAIMMRLSLLLAESGLGEEVRSGLMELNEDATRAANLTRQLLMFSRKSILQIRHLDLNGVVDNLLGMMKRLIQENIRLDWQGESGLPFIQADAGMMEQVVMNLVINARDAMPDGGFLRVSTQTVHIDEEQAKLHADRYPGGFVCLSVKDTGSGMEETTLKHLFEPFFSTKEIGKGTGLGLATIHGIIGQHKGWVEVASQLGKGSTFRVFLPVAEPKQSGADESRPSQKAYGGKETILLVEDEPSLLRLMARNLKSFGYSILECTNGQEALSIWEKRGGGVDLLFTDMVLSTGMNGLDLARILRKRNPCLKVILSSGYRDETDCQEQPDGENFLYLSKPFHLSQLARTVRDCLDRPVDHLEQP